MQKKPRLLLVGGGSGGHIVPNLAIATEIRSHLPEVDLLYVGSRGKLDRQLVESAGLKFKAIFTGKLRRYFSWKNFIDPFFILIGFLQSMGIILRFRPQVVFSKGGFVSVPVALAAYLLRAPVILHESDSRMGLANKIVSKFARRICTSFPDVLKGSKKVINTGNPVRTSILNGDPKKGYQLTGFSNKKPVVLAWGGSQGAQQINELIQSEWPKIKKTFQVIHITGKGNRSTVKDVNYKSYHYVDDDLRHLYAITDLVVGRAGANSIFETALMGKPTILIPLQNADQQKNAHYFESHGAALVWKKNDSLSKMLTELWKDKKQLASMKKALEKLSRPQAVKEIVEIIKKVISNKYKSDK